MNDEELENMLFALEAKAGEMSELQRAMVAIQRRLYEAIKRDRELFELRKKALLMSVETTSQLQALIKRTRGAPPRKGPKP